MRLFKRISILLTFLIIACKGPELPEELALVYDELPEKLDFNQDIKPILSDKCYLCHGPDKGKIEAGLQLHEAETAYAELPESPGKYAIVPGNAEKSELFHRILTEDPNLIMPEPDSHLTLTATEKAMLVKWIEDGAEYQDHWAFTPPQKPELPKAETGKIRNGIDHFVKAQLESAGLESSSEADKETL